MKSIGTQFLISSALVWPVVALEWITRRTLDEGLPWVLFTFMAIHSLLTVLLLTPAVRQLRAGGGLRALRVRHWAGCVLGVVLAFGYVNLLIDQLPCFLGVPNCD